jgi:hypothetical protein
MLFEVLNGPPTYQKAMTKAFKECGYFYEDIFG